MLGRVLFAFCVFGLAACGDLGTVSRPPSFVGTYTLQSINGEGLPWVSLQIGTTFRLEITAGSLTLNEDMTCSDSISFRETDNGNVTTTTDTDVCTYTHNSGAVILTYPADDSVIPGSIVGSQLTLTQDEAVFIFSR